MISSDRLFPQAQIYNFLRTVTIKYEPLADYINTTLLQKGYAVNPLDKNSWKYYLNMVGRYHVSDTKMYVMSIDTHETILFSPETLAVHKRTKVRYLPGGVYYNRLCESYPEQVDLIKSILFPVESLEKAIRSDDITLLQYGEGYLELHEESELIKKVHEFLLVIKERWYFDFLDDEPYFHITFWATLPILLAELLMVGRMDHLKTPYVHSFDLWSALEAQGLDNYSDILNREKSMMLYQNFGYLKTNAGKESNLVILADRLLGDLGIGLYGRMVVQEAETAKDQYQLTPQLVPIRLPSQSEALPAPVETKTIQTVQSEILDKGLTDSDSAEKVKTVERKLGDTTLNEYGTKFLEIRPIAQHKPWARVLENFLMETLLLSVTKGFYTKPIQIVEPLTRELIYLTPKEFIALYHYAIHKSVDVTVEDFPDAARFYYSFNPVIKTPVKTIRFNETKLYLSQVVETRGYLADLSYNRFIDSPEEFGEMVTRLWLRYMDHRLLDQGTKLEVNRAAYSYLNSLCHTRREENVSLVEGYSGYDEWLGSNGIGFKDNIVLQYNLQADPREHWTNLADTIITSLLPINDTLKIFGNFTLSDSGYNRLRQLFVQMCSYRVVFLQADRDIAEDSIGAKWSTDFGPDETQSFSAYTFPRFEQHANESVENQTLVTHPGINFLQEQETVETSNNIVTMDTRVVDNTTVFNHEAIYPSVITTTTEEVIGTITLGRSASLVLFD